MDSSLRVAGLRIPDDRNNSLVIAAKHTHHTEFLRHGLILRQIVYVADHNTHQHSKGENDHVARDVDSNERAG